MKESFVDYELAVKLKEKGFNEECLPRWGETSKQLYLLVMKSMKNDSFEKEDFTAAPLYQQVVDWLWDKHMIFISPVRESLGSDEWEFGYHIEWLPKDCWDLKRRGTSFKYENSYTESPGGTYYGAWPSISEALSEAIKKALTLIS